MRRNSIRCNHFLLLQDNVNKSLTLLRNLGTTPEGTACTVDVKGWSGGIVKPRQHDLPEPMAWRVIRRIEAGQTQQEVAQAIGVSQSRVGVDSRMQLNCEMHFKQQQDAWCQLKLSVIDCMEVVSMPVGPWCVPVKKIKIEIAPPAIAQMATSSPSVLRGIDETNLEKQTFLLEVCPRGNWSIIKIYVQ
ncbi:hypothetical protein C0J52_16964 [Blattella germanica]|nr:hypothetical protein C0J52_16964 [Blattella germanica]